jgi:hypothetical protein
LVGDRLGDSRHRGVTSPPDDALSERSGACRCTRWATACLSLGLTFASRNGSTARADRSLSSSRSG